MQYHDHLVGEYNTNNRFSKYIQIVVDTVKPIIWSNTLFLFEYSVHLFYVFIDFTPMFRSFGLLQHFLVMFWSNCHWSVLADNHILWLDRQSQNLNDLTNQSQFDGIKP